MRPIFFACFRDRPLRHEKLTALLEPVIAALGYQCPGVEYHTQGANGLLRVYIELDDRPVNVDDCERVSQELGAVLDREDPIPGHYTLEVSSPGLARPLFTAAQFARFIGEVARIQTSVPVAGRRRFQGRILEVDGETIVIEQDGQPQRLVVGQLLKAQLVPDWSRLGKHPGAARGRGTQP